MKKLEVKNVSKSFEGKPVLQDISIELGQGELVCLLGVSGGGKTTLFNVISGLLQPDTGHIFLDGEEITNKPGQISYMLQKDLLLPYRPIEDHVALPLLLKGKKKHVSMYPPCLNSLAWREPRNSFLPSCPAVCVSGQRFCVPICFLRMWHCWTNPFPLWIR